MGLDGFGQEEYLDRFRSGDSSISASSNAAVMALENMARCIGALEARKTYIPGQNAERERIASCYPCTGDARQPRDRSDREYRCQD